MIYIYITKNVNHDSKYYNIKYIIHICIRSRPELCVNKKKGVQLKRKFVIFDLRKKTFTNNILGERYE